jgi:hypothetical protein
MMTQLFRCFALLLFALASSSAAQAQDVIAFWGWTDDYDFSATAPNKMDFGIDDGIDTTANMQLFLGNADQLDHNGGGGFVPYTSPVSGLTYETTRTAKWDDIRGGGDDFDIGGIATFTVDKNDGAGAVAGEDFGNDALMYITFDGTGYQDFEFRFDAESTPGDLAESFDVFYRVGGVGTWFREATQNNIPLNYMDYDTPDPENQFTDSGYISLNSALNSQSQIEVIVSDFAELGNNEFEIDNFEIVGTAVPEPASAIVVVALGIVGLIKRRR